MGPEGPRSERARQAALVLSGVAQEVSDESPGVLLLADLRDLWQQHGHAKSVTTAELVSALHRRDDRPWKEWYRGQPITNRGIAKLLGRYGIGPTQLPKPDNRKGYVFADFSEAWARYLPPEDPNPLKPACENNNLGSVSRPKPVGTVSDLEWKVSSEIYGQVSDVSA